MKKAVIGFVLGWSMAIILALSLMAASARKAAIRILGHEEENKSVWVMPFSASVFHARIEAGTVPAKGTVMCEQKNEARPDSDGVSRRTPPILYCEDGIRLAVDGVIVIPEDR